MIIPVVRRLDQQRNLLCLELLCDVVYRLTERTSSIYGCFSYEVNTPAAIAWISLTEVRVRWVSFFALLECLSEYCHGTLMIDLSFDGKLRSFIPIDSDAVVTISKVALQLNGSLQNFVLCRVKRKSLAP